VALGRPRAPAAWGRCCWDIYDAEKACICGRRGTGFKDEIPPALRRSCTAGPVSQPHSPIAWPKAGALFRQPKLVEQVEYRRKGPEGILQSAAFKVLLTDKNPYESNSIICRKVIHGITTLWTRLNNVWLVNIPVKLVVAVARENISSHMRTTRIMWRLHGRSGLPLPTALKFHAEHTSGIEVLPGEYVVVREAELEAAAHNKIKTIEIEDFVDLDADRPALPSIGLLHRAAASGVRRRACWSRQWKKAKSC